MKKSFTYSFYLFFALSLSLSSWVESASITRLAPFWFTCPMEQALMKSDSGDDLTSPCWNSGYK
jgi:hypothetical protein